MLNSRTFRDRYSLLHVDIESSSLHKSKNSNLKHRLEMKKVLFAGLILMGLAGSQSALAQDVKKVQETKTKVEQADVKKAEGQVKAEAGKKEMKPKASLKEVKVEPDKKDVCKKKNEQGKKLEEQLTKEVK